MQQEHKFYTLKGYQLIEDALLTSAMEDYLEMICRILSEKKKCESVIYQNHFMYALLLPQKW